MLIPDPVSIGWPKRGEPRCIGRLENHDLAGQFIPGHKIMYNTFEGPAVFRVGVSYTPDRGRYKTLTVILVPDKVLPEEIWEYDGFVLTANLPKKTPEVKPNFETMTEYLARKRREKETLHLSFALATGKLVK